MENARWSNHQQKKQAKLCKNAQKLEWQQNYVKTPKHLGWWCKPQNGPPAKTWAFSMYENKPWILIINYLFHIRIILGLPEPSSKISLIKRKSGFLKVLCRIKAGWRSIFFTIRILSFSESWRNTDFYAKKHC